MNYNLLLMPFISKSKVFVKDLNLSISNPKEEDLSFVEAMLKDILKKDYYFPKIEDKLLKKYFIFYPYARIILSIINKTNFYMGFYNFYYKSILKEIENNEILFLQNLNIDFDLYQDKYKVFFKDYIFAKIKNEKDKLENKPLKKGYVYLTKSDLKNFVARFVATKTIFDLPLNTKDISNLFFKVAENLKKQIYVRKRNINIGNQKTEFKYLPECIQDIISELLNGGNPTHIERYYLATILFTLKMDLESVLDIFSNASNFKEQITKYQLTKIKNYSAPSFQTLRSMGFCNDEKYNNFKTPIDYYFYMKKQAKYNKQKEELIKKQNLEKDKNTTEENKTI